ncbi:putative polygalacturonase 2 [Diplocarpon rosae]|nr:putative polygalacturonase 2 [Diplocarpon rosae]
MVHISVIAGLLASVANIASAAPIIEERGACTFSGASGAAAAIKGKGACASITLSNIVVPAGTTLDLTKLNKGTKVIFQGTTTFGYEEWSGPLISISGESINVVGAPGNSIDGGGARWWDGKGGNGGKTKPKFFYAHSLTSSSITGLNFKNTPVQMMSIDNANGLAVTNIKMDNTAGDKGSIGHNTDAFDVGKSTGVVIAGAHIQNQDDCLAINSGTGITFIGGFCSGGHGLSIGSVGGRSDNVVKNINIASSAITNSDNGVRIKTISGATGSVSGVIYKDIKLSNIRKYGIVIQQDYKNGSPTGTPTTGVPITGISITGVTGTVASSGVNVYILCGKGSCSNWVWAANSVTGGHTSTKCLNVPRGAKC